MACARLIRALWMGVLLAGCGSAAGGPLPPAQPQRGPGGAEYLHGDVEMNIAFEDGALGARVYIPRQPDVSSAAPVVVFMHGYQAMGAWYYDNWIAHLVRRGNVVIFPVFMERYNVPTRFTDNAEHGLQEALDLLRQKGVPLDLDRVMFVGHSGGAVIAVNLAVKAAGGRLPLRPRALLLAAPGRCLACEQRTGPGIPMADPVGISPDVRMVVLAYDNDVVVGNALAYSIFRSAPMPRAYKTLVRVRSDEYGQPPLVAGHRSPAASARDVEGDFGTDALDFYGTWKLADALEACTFDGAWCDVALGEGDAQKHMGFWSDGTPVRGMLNP